MASSLSFKSSSKKKTPSILPNDIKCVLIQGYGSIRQLKAISIPRPKPGDGEVLVHVRAWYEIFVYFNLKIINI